MGSVSYEATYHTPLALKEFRMTEYGDHINRWLDFYNMALPSLLDWRRSYWERKATPRSQCCRHGGAWQCNRWVSVNNWEINDGPKDECKRPTEVGAYGNLGWDTVSIFFLVSNVFALSYLLTYFIKLFVRLMSGVRLGLEQLDSIVVHVITILFQLLIQIIYEILL